MTTSALLRHGPKHAAALLDGLAEWMQQKGFTRLADVRGMLAMPADAAETGYERAGYVAALRSANLGTGPWR